MTSLPVPTHRYAYNNAAIKQIVDFLHEPRSNGDDPSTSIEIIAAPLVHMQSRRDWGKPHILSQEEYEFLLMELSTQALEGAVREELETTRCAKTRMCAPSEHAGAFVHDEVFYLPDSSSSSSRVEEAALYVHRHEGTLSASLYVIAQSQPRFHLKILDEIRWQEQLFPDKREHVAFLYTPYKRRFSSADDSAYLGPHLAALIGEMHKKNAVSRHIIGMEHTISEHTTLMHHMSLQEPLQIPTAKGNTVDLVREMMRGFGTFMCYAAENFDRLFGAPQKAHADVWRFGSEKAEYLGREGVDVPIRPLCLPVHLPALKREIRS